ncbi:MAG: tetratricopeptide repeat protein [Candidatus Latescibacterota bacterium]|nr:tetratricopeptide repeat protein [Candidatus Latescibacterota bacterium]
MNQPAPCSKWTWALVLAVAAGPYLNTLNGGFHYDDEHALVRNTHLRQLSAVPSFFVDSSTFSSEPDMAMYRPLLQTTFALNHALGGYDAWSWHLVNVLLHALAATGAFALFRRLLPSAPALAAGLLFAVHPVHSQAVNYLSSRSETMCMALVMWALVLLQARHGIWSAVIYAGALLTKSAAVALLPVAALIQWRLPAHQRDWKSLLPHGLVSVLYVSLISIEGFLPRSLSQGVRPFDVQIWTQLKALIYYLQMTVLPRGLSVEHDFKISNALWDPPVTLAAAILLSVVWLHREALRSRVSLAGLGALWFVAALGVPLLVPLNVLVNEHRLYLPVAGFAVAAAVPMMSRVVPRSVPVLLCVVFVATSVAQNRLWQNDLSLWTAAVRRAPNSSRAWSNLALALHAEGELDSANVAYHRALTLNPGQARAWNNLGLLLEESGRLEEARSAYSQAAGHSTSFSGPLANLGRLALATRDRDGADTALAAALLRNGRDVDAILHQGRLLQMRGHSDSARANFVRVLDLDPMSAAAANNLGMLAAERGDRATAQRWLRRALVLDPDNEEAGANLMLLEFEAEGIERRDAYHQVLARFPGRAELSLALGNLHAKAGAWEAAVEVLRTAVERGAFVPGLQAALGAASQKAGLLDQALISCRLAARETPESALAWNALAAAAAAAGRAHEARQATLQALKLDPRNAHAKANLKRLDGHQPSPVSDSRKAGK